MRKLLTWIVVTLGIAALIRRLRRRGAEPEPAPVEPRAEDPADELRQRLAESRSADEPEEAPSPPEETVEERRSEVHDQGRATLDEMRPSDEEQ
jgi:flagellar biosynthesis/type III secretory pathway M-ring protein FliF/YscJ